MIFSEYNCREKRIIDSLRVGIIGDEGVRELTVGREKEMRIIDQWISKPEGSITVIGPYGMGKTHTNRYIEKTSLDSKFGVAYIQIGNDSPLHKPTKIFQAIFENLRFQKNEDILNIHDFFEEYIKFALENHLENNYLWSNTFLRPLYEIALRHYKSFNVIQSSDYFTRYHYLLGKIPNKPYGVRYSIPNENYRTSANLYFNMLSSISLASKQIGFNGIILLFDELEKNDTVRNTSWKEKGEEFMTALGLVSKNESCLLDEYVEALPKGGYYGEKSRLQYSGYYLNRSKSFLKKVKDDYGYTRENRFFDVSHRYLPHDSDENTKVGIKCAFSFVEGQGDMFLERAKNLGFLEIKLSPLDKNHEEMLVKKIITVYKKAFSNDERFLKKFADNENELVENVMKIYQDKKRDSEAVRKLIKLTVSIMDSFRLHRMDKLDLILDDLHDRF